MYVFENMGPSTLNSGFWTTSWVTEEGMHEFCIFKPVCCPGVNIGFLPCVTASSRCEPDNKKGRSGN